MSTFTSISPFHQYPQGSRHHHPRRTSLCVCGAARQQLPDSASAQNGPLPASVLQRKLRAAWLCGVRLFFPPLFAVLLGKDSRRKVFVSRGTSTGWPRDGRGSSSDGDGGVLEARVLETQLYVYDCTVGFIIVVIFITVQHSTIPGGMVVVVLEYVLTCVLSEVRRRVQLPTQKGTVTLLLYYYADLWYLGVIAQRKRI